MSAKIAAATMCAALGVAAYFTPKPVLKEIAAKLPSAVADASQTAISSVTNFARDNGFELIAVHRLGNHDADDAANCLGKANEGSASIAGRNSFKVTCGIDRVHGHDAFVKFAIPGEDVRVGYFPDESKVQVTVGEGMDYSDSFKMKITKTFPVVDGHAVITTSGATSIALSELSDLVIRSGKDSGRWKLDFGS